MGFTRLGVRRGRRRADDGLGRLLRVGGLLGGGIPLLGAEALRLGWAA